MRPPGSYIDNMEGDFMNNGSIVVGSILALAILIALFFIFRAIVVWYWRVGEVINLLESIDERLERMESRGP